MTFRYQGVCICESAEPNDGIVKAMFVPRQRAAEGALKQPEAIWINLDKGNGIPEIGKPYFVSVTPAFPTEA